MWIRLNDYLPFAVNEQGQLKNIETGIIQKQSDKKYHFFVYDRVRHENIRLCKNELIKEYFPDEYKMNIQKIFTEISEPDEEWKELDEYPGYLISNYGKVYNLNYFRLLKWCFSGNGYPFVNLKNREGKTKQPAVHRLVAENFVSNPNPESYNEVNHLDHNRANPIWSNLEWTSHLLNMRDRTAYGSGFYVLPERNSKRGRPSINIKEENLPTEPITDPEDPRFWA